MPCGIVYLPSNKYSKINLLIPIHKGLHILKVWKTENYHLIKEVMIAKLIPYKNMFLQQITSTVG